MTIERFVHVDGNDNESETEYDSLQEAREHVPAGSAICARIYEYADTEPVWTPNGDDTWPPPRRNA